MGNDNRESLPGYVESIGLTAQFGATMLSAAMVGNTVFKLLIAIVSSVIGLALLQVIRWMRRMGWRPSVLPHGEGTRR